MIAEDLSDYLVANGGYVDGTNLFRYGTPEHPANVIVVSPAGGFQPIHTMSPTAGSSKTVEQPIVQIKVRNEKSTDCATVANTVFKLLDGLPETTINGTRYLGMQALASPQLMGRDDNGWVTLAFNVAVMKALS